MTPSWLTLHSGLCSAWSTENGRMDFWLVSKICVCVYYSLRCLNSFVILFFIGNGYIYALCCRHDTDREWSSRSEFNALHSSWRLKDFNVRGSVLSLSIYCTYCGCFTLNMCVKVNHDRYVMVSVQLSLKKITSHIHKTHSMVTYHIFHPLYYIPVSI